MKKTNFRLRLCIALLVLNLVFIWGNSLLPGEISGAFSRWVKELLGIAPGDPHTGHGMLRKLAHFTEFACLGLCLQWLHGMLRKPVWRSLLCGFAAACLDECIQIFVPDRGPAIKDVLIDTSGVLLGVMLLWICIILKLKKSKENIQ